MKRTLLTLGLMAMLGVFGTAQAAGDAAAGKTKAATCSGCHGAKGEGVKPNPPIAGIAQDKFVQAMKDYKSGKRANAAMKMFAGKLSDGDMADLAAHFASLKGK